MKAEELMIGDWVLYESKPNMISEISEEIVGEATVCFVGNRYMANIDEVEPIPLTTEILEKNGFVLRDDEIGWHGVKFEPYFTRDDVPFEIFCDGEPFSIWFRDPVNIEYIHQLQHVMRLCGITREIII